MVRNTRKSRWTCAIWLAAVATAGSAYAGQLFSFEDADTVSSGTQTFVGGIESVHHDPPGSQASVPSWPFAWGDSFDANQCDHARSTIGVTDGSYSMLIHNANTGASGFSWGTQVWLNSGFDAAGDAKFNDLTTSTKLLVDISTPGASPVPNSLPQYQVGFGAINYAAGFLTSYNIADAGNNYQFTSGPQNQEALTTQTYVWDFGGQMRAATGSLWPSLSAYVILHFNNNGPNPGPAQDYYYDNVRCVNEDITRPTWNAPLAGGNWTDGGAWNNGVPNAVGAAAIFSGANATNGTLALSSTVTLNSAATVGSIIFDAKITSYQYIGASGSVTSADLLPAVVNYTVAGTGSLTLDVASGRAEIYAIAGQHTIGVPVLLQDDTAIDLAAGFGPDNNVNLPGGGRFSSTTVPTLSFGAPVTLASGTTLTKRGAGTVTFAALRGGGALDVRGGAVTVSAKGSPNSASGTSVVTALTVSPFAKLDLTNNSAVIDYSGLVGTLVADTRAMLADGRLTSSSADGTHRLGYGDNGVLGKASFGGQTVDASSLLIKFTYVGDANLDGQVDITDLAALATAWQTNAPWSSGDFDYSGFVDITDLAGLATNWQAGVGAPLAMSFEQALASVGLGGVNVVPEPAVMASLALAGLTLLRRRR